MICISPYNVYHDIMKACLIYVKDEGEIITFTAFENLVSFSHV